MTVILFLIAGITAGYLFRGRARVSATAERATGPAIYVLLFLLGLSVGTNNVIMQALTQLSVQALALSLGSMLGSIWLVFLVYIVFFRGTDDAR